MLRLTGCARSAWRPGVLLTGVYGSGKSAVAEEIAYLLEQWAEPYALLDLDYLSWAGTGADDRAAEFGLMGRRDDLRQAAASIAAAEGAGVEDVVIGNDHPIGVVAQDVLSFLGWPPATFGLG